MPRYSGAAFLSFLVVFIDLCLRYLAMVIFLAIVTLSVDTSTPSFHHQCTVEPVIVTFRLTSHCLMVLFFFHFANFFTLQLLYLVASISSQVPFLHSFSTFFNFASFSTLRLSLLCCVLNSTVLSPYFTSVDCLCV